MPRLSEEELDSLAAQVDAQLSAWSAEAGRGGPAGKGGKRKPGPLPPAPLQQAVIEHATGEDFAGFWQKFRRQARYDLCAPGGLMCEKWQKRQGIDSKTAVGSVRGILLGMGMAEHSIPLLLVAVTAFLLYALANIGIKAICEDCEKP